MKIILTVLRRVSCKKMEKRELSWEFKQQLKKSICEFEEKLKTRPTRDELSGEFEKHVKESNAEFEEKLKKDRADLECIIQDMKSEVCFSSIRKHGYLLFFFFFLT